MTRARPQHTQNPVHTTAEDPFKGLLMATKPPGATASTASTSTSTSVLHQAAAGLFTTTTHYRSSTSSSTSSTTTSSSRFLLPPDPLTDASASLAANFSRQDVLNLLAILVNQGLAQELRRSAAEELLALCPEPQLLAVMVQQQHLEAVWRLCLVPTE